MSKPISKRKRARSILQDATRVAFARSGEDPVLLSGLQSIEMPHQTWEEGALLPELRAPSLAQSTLIMRGIYVPLECGSMGDAQLAAEECSFGVTFPKSVGSTRRAAFRGVFISIVTAVPRRQAVRFEAKVGIVGGIFWY